MISPHCDPRVGWEQWEAEVNVPGSGLISLQTFLESMPTMFEQRGYFAFFYLLLQGGLMQEWGGMAFNNVKAAFSLFFDLSSDLFSHSSC